MKVEREVKRGGRKKMCNRHRRFKQEEKTTTRTRKVESLKEGFKVKQGKMIN